jgi:hypothetical protein
LHVGASNSLVGNSEVECEKPVTKSAVTRLSPPELHWRAGCEANISTLKHLFSLLYAACRNGKRGTGEAMPNGMESPPQRSKPPSEIARLAEVAVCGTLSETGRLSLPPQGGPNMGPT